MRERSESGTLIERDFIRLKPYYVYSILCMIVRTYSQWYNSMTQALIPVLEAREGAITKLCHWANSDLTHDNSDDFLILKECLDAKLSERTRRTYLYGYKSFAEFLGVSIPEAGRLLLSSSHGDANRTVFRFRTWLQDKGLAAKTINSKLDALSALVTFARVIDRITWTLDVDRFKVTKYRDTKGPGMTGFQRMLTCAEQRRDRLGIRDQCLISLLYDLALRRAEVSALDLDDVDLKAEEPRLTIRGKGRYEDEFMTIPIPTQALLAAWLKVRGPAPGPLFYNFDRSSKGRHNDRRLSGTSINRIVHKLAHQAEVKTSAHGLRHAAITAARDLTNGNVLSMREFSRHRDLNTLMDYCRNREDLAGSVARLVADRARLEK